MTKARLPVLFFAIALAGCGDERDPARPGDAGDAGTIYVEHSIRGAEDREEVTVTLQFRKGDSGKNILMPDGSVTLDGIALTGDSSALGGAFYDATMPAATAAGLHVVSYDTGDGKRVSDSFIFQPFSLPPDLPPLRRGVDWPVALSVTEGSTVLVALTDTAFETNDIVETVPVRGGAVLLRAERLQTLAPGPVLLEITTVASRKPGGGAKGQIRVEYNVRRELVLKQ